MRRLDDERIGLAIFGLESELVLIIASWDRLTVQASTAHHTALFDCQGTPGWIAIVGYDLRLMLHWPHSQLDERVTLGACKFRRGFVRQEIFSTSVHQAVQKFDEMPNGARSVRTGRFPPH